MEVIHPLRRSRRLIDHQSLVSQNNTIVIDDDILEVVSPAISISMCYCCGAEGHPSYESCIRVRRSMMANICAKDTCNICMRKGHVNDECLHPVIDYVVQKSKETCLFHSVSMIREFLQKLRTNELRSLCFSMNLRIDLPRKEMLRLSETILCIHSKINLLEKMKQMVNHAIRQMQEPDEEVRHSLTTRLESYTRKMETLEKNLSQLFTKEKRPISIHGAARKTSVYVLTRNAKHVRDQIPALFPKFVAPTVSSECSICFEPVAPTCQVQTECNHVYCVDCMQAYMETCVDVCHPSCALCRRPIEAIFI